MKISTRLRLRVLVAVAILIGAGGYCAYRFTRQRHESTKFKRIGAYSEIIWRHSESSALPTELVRAVILAESGGDPKAVSKKNAKGLMQITPIAEREVLKRTDLTKGDLFDPDYNVLIGTKYLRMLIDRFDGDLHLALAAYNMGPTRVQRLRREHPDLSGRELIDKHAFRSTARYCRTILADKSIHLRR